MKKGLTLLLVGSLVGASLWPSRTSAQVVEPAENRGAAAAWQALIRLRTTASVMHTTAHPDDEDGALLVSLSRFQGVRTGLLTLNRGEGGANLIGPELYDALGILRTEELLAAGRYYGVEQFFTRATDFGFSKRLDETLEHWDREQVLGDMVRAIRRFRPEIIVSRFHGAARDGHGNHQAAGLLSREAYKAAADPERFREQLREGLRPWQAKKLYLSVRESEPAATLRIDVGVYDPLLGRSAREIGREGLSHQRSQGAGQVRVAPGRAMTAVVLVESAIPRVEREQSLFDGIDTSIRALAGLAGALDIGADLSAIESRVEAAVKGFNAREPWRIVPDLAAGLKATRALTGRVKAAQLDAANKDHLLFHLERKEREFNAAINAALGLAMDVVVDPLRPAEGPMSGFMPRETIRVATPGERFTLTASAVNRSPVAITPRSIALVTKGWSTTTRREQIKPLGENERAEAQFEATVPADAEYSRPYWSRENELRDHLYRIDKPEYLGMPFAPPEVVGVMKYEVEGVECEISRPAQTVYVDRPRGEQRRLLAVAPAISILLARRVGVLPVADASSTFSVEARVASNVKGEAAGRVRLKLPPGWSSTPAEMPFRFTREGEQASFTFRVAAPRVAAGTQYEVQAVAEYGGREYGEGYEVIAHRDLEPRHLYRPARMTVRGIDVRVAPGLTVGYVMGVGDEMPQALEQIGVKVVMLGEADLASGDLGRFDAILVGIRATAVRADLKAYYRRLLEYCERGGHLIYQYQTQEFDEAPYGPYPYKLTARAEEVSEEEAMVKVLVPEAAIFQRPNRITEEDFKGWVEERGSKWMTTWDERYRAMLESHDREQPPQRGGLLQAEYGKGTFTYAAYAFYRQLPAGVPGAYRLFANLISYKR